VAPYQMPKIPARMTRRKEMRMDQRFWRSIPFDLYESEAGRGQARQARKEVTNEFGCAPARICTTWGL
jgi:hypothetical protein